MASPRAIGWAVSIAATLVASPPSVADGPDGIAFAQAEEGTWWCQGTEASDALDCALERCRAEADGQNCIPARWCYPAGWSGLMIVWLPEFHATQVVCGLPGRDATMEALRAICLNAPEFSRCDLVMTIDADGREERYEEVIDPFSHISE